MKSGSKLTKAKDLIATCPDLVASPQVPSGLNLFTHQGEAFTRIVKRLLASKSVYYAADPGLGKTIVAAIVSNYFRNSVIFYVCPAFLTANTKEEFAKWCVKNEKFLYLIPDSMIGKKKTFEAFEQAIRHALDPILVVDEGHRFKNLSAKRTKALLRVYLPKFKGRVIFMSGTPMPNSRPIELWPILKAAAPEIFGENFFAFAIKYCGGFKGPFGWDFSGFTNRKEFKLRVQKSFMIRHKKSLLDLPPKREALLTVGEGVPEVENLERKILAKYPKEDVISGEVLEFFGLEDGAHLSTYLRVLGSWKLKYVLPVIEQLLEETDESLLVFAMHKDVIRTLEKRLKKWKPYVITGDVPVKKRHGISKEFQKSKDRRILIGNIQACGLGLTLTKATRVLFCEFSWVDGDNSQASDRVHRIGQNKSVLIQYVVLSGSIDHKRMEAVLKKRELSI